MRKLTWIFFIGIVIFSAQSVRALGLDDVKKSYVEGDYIKVIEQTGALKGRSYMLSRDPELLYLEANSYLALGDTKKARHCFKTILLGKSLRYKDKARLGYADSYLLDFEFSKAKKEYEAGLKEANDKELIPLWTLRLGQVSKKMGQWSNARMYLKRVQARYPDSPEAQIAKDILKEDSFFTVQAGSFLTHENANELKDELKQKGFPAYVKQVKEAGAPYYRVRVGKFNKREDALDVKNRLGIQGYSTYIIP